MTSLNKNSLTISDFDLTAGASGNIVTSNMLARFATSTSDATYSDSVVRPIGSIIIAVTSSRTNGPTFKINMASGKWRGASVYGLSNVYAGSINDTQAFSVGQSGMAIAYRAS